LLNLQIILGFLLAILYTIFTLLDDPMMTFCLRGLQTYNHLNKMEVNIKDFPFAYYLSSGRAPPSPSSTPNQSTTPNIQLPADPQMFSVFLL